MALSISDFADKTADEVTSGLQLIGHNESENISMTPMEINVAGVVEYTFTSASVWTVNHNRGRHPTVALLTTGGIHMQGEVLKVTENQFQVLWAAPTAGKVHVS